MYYGAVVARVNNEVEERRLYQSKIIKAGALLADTKTLLAHWDETCSVSENLARFRWEISLAKRRVLELKTSSPSYANDTLLLNLLRKRWRRS